MTAICVLPSLHVVMTSTRSSSSSSFVLSILQTIFIDPSKDINGFVLGEMKSIKEILCKDNLIQLFKTLFVWEDRVVSSSTSV